MALEPGTRVGDWVVEETLDAVDRYRCHRIDSPFRKAVLRVVRATDVASLEHEARRLSRLEHPNIQGVLGLETSGEDLFLVTEATEGTFLDAFVKKPPLPLRTCLEVASQVAEALTAIHAEGLSHGDLRPENVLLTADGRAILVGFNLRASLESPVLDDSYVPPEATRQTGPHRDCHDCYAFGVLLVELITGERVRPRPAMMRSALSLEIDVPDALRDLVVRLTHPDPASRADIETAREALSLALRQSLGDHDDDRMSAAATFVDLDGPPLPSEGGAHAPGNVGRYRILGELGRGGVGVVYEAEDPDLERRVALKVLLAGAFARARDIERFMREARAVARLDHPHIVKILELGRGDDGAWFAMEYVEGPTLLDKVRDDGPLSWEEATSVAASLARALQHAHDAGLVHRDVKPNNVLLEAGHRPKLTDFGLALEAQQDTNRLTRTGQVLGTPMYMAPEQAVGDLHKLGPHTDVYALGVVLYESLTGRVPYDGATPLQVIGKVLAGDPVAPRTLVPTLPRAIDMVCLKAMQRDIGDRYPSAGELADDLERCLRGEPVVAAAPTLSARVRWFVRRNRMPLGLAAVAMAVSVVVLLAVQGIASSQAAHRAAQREQTAATRLRAVQGRIATLEGSGERAEADALWAEFTDNPDHRGTRALAEGWLSRAGQLTDRDQLEEARAAYARAYADAAHGDIQGRALVELAHVLEAEGETALLPMVVDTLRRRTPQLADSDEVRRLSMLAAASHRDFAAAAGFAEPGPVRRVLTAFQSSTPTGHRADTVLPWHGPEGEWMLRDGEQDRIVITRGDPQLTEARSLPLPVPLAARRVIPLRSDPPTLLGSGRRGGTVLLQLRDNGLRVVGDWPERPVSEATSADLDGDGRVEHYYGVDRQLYRLSSTGDTWTQDDPHPPTNAANSHIEAVRQADLDGDGSPELVVSAAEWGAYDVRVLRGNRDGSMTLTARNKLGVVTDLALVPRPDGQDVLANKHDRYANLRVFPADEPLGAPRGLYRLSLDGDELETELIAPDLTCFAIVTGDWDGDGRYDAATQCGSDVVLLMQGPDGAWEQLRIRELRLLAGGDLDDDPRQELIVAVDSEVWVLGAGATMPPPVVAGTAPIEAPPEGMDPGFRATWRRAEDLAYIGQTTQAAESLRALANLAWGTDVGNRALLRAGDLHAQQGAWSDAAEAYLEAAAEGRARDALPAAARSLERARDLTGEFEVLERLRDEGLLDDSTRQRLARLQPLADPPRLDLDFTQPIDPRWEIADPLALRRADEGLRVTAYGNEVLARLPIAWDGEYLQVELHAAIHTTEWFGGLEVSVVPRGWGEPPYGVRIEGRGGGGYVHTNLRCSAGGHSLERRIDAPEAPVVMRARVYPAQEGLSCEVEQEGHAPWRVYTERELPPPFEDGWDLVLRATGGADTLTDATIRELHLLGAELAGGEPVDHPVATARRALVEGDRATATRALERWTGMDPALEVALAADGDDAALQSALLAAMASGAERPVLHLLHPRLEAHETTLRQTLGSRYWWWLWRAWRTTLVAHRHDTAALAPLLPRLEGVEQVQPDTVEESLAAVELLALRGHDLVRSGRDGAARVALHRALLLHRSLLGSSDPILEDSADVLRSAAASAQVDLAVALLRAGERDLAIEALQHALDVSGSPVVTADQIRVRPELASLGDDPRWTALLRARR